MKQQENSSVTEGADAQVDQADAPEVHADAQPNLVPADTELMAPLIDPDLDKLYYPYAPEVLPFIEPATPETPTPLDDTPTIEDAQLMFAERPDLANVLTDEGWLSRDGILTVALTGK